ncbi:protein HEG homolog 1 isoform X2 [Nannospalax galili]|uniref:protein HEG homolog 1 isoform X2 n=1 Tax=Nannospalax galili TaxID=1026970 RepID=UPI00111C8AB3|nr:protein HEG homolog 1 isoform X2 [Nannospalax galili]
MGNTPFYQSQEDHSAVGSRKGVPAQTIRVSHTSSEAPEIFSLLPETASAESRHVSSSRTNITILPVGHSPGITTALTSQGSSFSSERLPLSTSSSGSGERMAHSHTESGTSPGLLERERGLPEEGTVHTQVTDTLVSSQSSLPSRELREPSMPSRKRNYLGLDPSVWQFSQTPTHPPSSDHPSSSGSTKKHNNSTALQSPSVTQTQSSHLASTFTNGAPRTLQSLTVSMKPINETEGFPEGSKTATASASVHSSPTMVDSRTNSRLAGNPGDVIEPSTEHEFGLTSLDWQSDSPPFGHQLASSSEAENGSFGPQTETIFRSVPSLRDGESTASWFWAKNKAPEDVTESSALHLEVVNTSVLTQFLDSAQQPRVDNTGLGERSYSESSSSSSSESPDSSAPRGEHSALEDSVVLSDSSDLEESTSGARTSHTLASLPRSGERTLRSLSPSRAVTHPARPTPRGNVTEHAGLVAGVPAALGVTGLSYDQVRGTGTEQRTSSDHTDHTYVSSTFTKGERALLSITDNGSSSDTSENSTSYIKVSNSPYLDYSSPSQTQTERRNLSYDDEHTQSSTESLVLRKSNPPSYTSTVNMPNTLILLDANTESVGDTSSGTPLALPSVSQSQQLFSSTLPSTRFPTQQLKSTSEAATPLSSSPSPLPVSLTVSTPTPHSVSQTTFPPSSSTLVLHRARETRVTSVQTSTMISALTVFHSNQTADPKNQSTPEQEKIFSEAKSPSLVSLSTDSTKPMSFPSKAPLPPALTDSSTKPALPATSTSLAQMSPVLTATTSQTIHSPATSKPSTLSNTEALVPSPVVVHTTTGKQLLPTHPEILVPQISTDGATTTEKNQMHIDPTTRLISLTTAPTSAQESTTSLSNTEEYRPVSHFLSTSSPQTTAVSTTEALTTRSTTFAAQSTTQSAAALSPQTPVNGCAMNPCLHGGKCIVDLTGRGYRCVCSPAWQGDSCSVDVNECLSNPCPPLALCNNTQGSFICKCPVGYQLEKGICNLVRTFVTEFKLKKTFLNTTVENHSDLDEVESEITQTLNVCFTALPGYIRSTVHASREPSVVVISLQTTFALASNVTLFDLADGIQKYVNSCKSSAEVCQLLGSQRRIFRAGSLCKRKSPECDRETSICTDLDGVALCQCKSGYFQFNKMDHSCRACEDGYRLENETCMSCPFGLGGLNCGNPYQLITVVIAAAGGGLLLILGIALIVTCCRKSKNDISKLIFKSGDFQMSPYAEYPKNPRSQEWGREAIEMHENGSTKNLLQMTDVYYSPTNVRNPELERNGLYPAYTGLPGSRHSCIFPGQYNPSFISDESRRRDYF